MSKLKHPQNQNTNNKKNPQRGVGLTEVLVSIAVFTIGMVAIGLFILDVLRTTEQSQDINQAVLIATEGIEAAKYIRDVDFSSIDNGDGWRALEISDDTWIFTGDSTSTIELGSSGAGHGKTYYRSIVISDSGLGDDDAATTSVKLIESRVEWAGRSGTSSLSLKTYLTNWER